MENQWIGSRSLVHEGDSPSICIEWKTRPKAGAPGGTSRWILAVITCLLAVSSGTDRVGATEAPHGRRTLNNGGLPIVNTTSGPVLGLLQEGLHVFRGIPYAAPPVGDLRWKLPQPAEPWTLVRSAWRFSPPCPQFDFEGNPAGNEDCLYLNVWTPAAQRLAGLPVMVWIHGGGWTAGSGDGGRSAIDGKSIYDGQHLARNEDVVVVSFNYRLGPFGFLAHPELTTEDPRHPSSGNYGQEDQITALEWVHDNIAAFGGDPNHVTIFGESAGGGSAAFHLVSPQSAGLFHGAIIQSGGLLDRTLSLEQAEAQGLAFAEVLQCEGAPDVPDCLRSKSQNEILKALPLPLGFFFSEGAFWGPVVDKYIFPVQPTDAFLTGRFSQVPIIIGNTAHEGTLFPALVGAGLSPTEYNAFLDRFFGAAADAVRAEYPCSEADCSAFEPPQFLLTPADNAAAEVITNGFFICPSRRVARAISTTGVPVHFYLFTHEIVSPFFPFELGATHAAELSFVFGTAALSQLIEEELPLSQAMMGYWADFARDGNPNHLGASGWPAYRVELEGEDEERLELDLPLTVTAGFEANNCDFFDALLP